MEMKNGGASQACAACKYQRRKCSRDCPLSPFFPADQPNKFQCAHRLFGVRNIMSILKQVKDESKQDAMTSIIFESNMRARFPVHGCLGIINQLQTQIDQTAEELRAVRGQIEMCKHQGVDPMINNSIDQQNILQYNNNDNTNVGVVPMVVPDHGFHFLSNGLNDIYFNSEQNNEDVYDDKIIQNPSFGNELLFAPHEYRNQPELEVSQYDDDVDDDHKQSPHDSSPKSIFEREYNSAELTGGKVQKIEV